MKVSISAFILSVDKICRTRGHIYHRVATSGTCIYYCRHQLLTPGKVQE